MTEEEINKKAEKHCNEVLCNEHEKCNEVIKCRDWRSRRAGYFCGYEQALKDFEKENAELKEKLNFSTQYYQGEKAKEQLTKAKDHIKKLLGCLQQDTNDPQTNYYVVQYMTEAEQFLKDFEK